MNKKPTIAKDVVLWFLNQKYVVSKFWDMQQGMESQVFGYSTNNKSFVIRLNREEDGFNKDHLCYELFSNHLPIPKIVAIGVFSADMYYCISEYVESKTLQDVPGNMLGTYLDKVLNVHQHLSQIETENFEGFGVFNSSMGTLFRSWKDYLLSTVDGKRLHWDEIDLSEKRRSFILRVEKKYRHLVESCPEDRNFYHGDFGSNNILIQNENIVGVIDWDCAGIGDSLIDVAGTHFWASHLICMKKQAKYFDNKLSHLNNYNDRILCYQIRIGLEEVYESFADGESDKTISWLFNRLEKVSSI